MWSSKLLSRLVLVIGLSGLTAGCFQPLYGDSSVLGAASAGNGSVKDKMATVEVANIPITGNTRVGHITVELRNNLIFEMTGGSGGAAPLYRLNVSLSPSRTSAIVDINSGRPDLQVYGLDVSYSLVEISTGKPVVSGQTFSRVSYDIPGQQQRFAGDRGLRDAETRAAKVIADNIRNRLASYFAAGT
jgi:LPS-assembly lipoprotein